MKRARHPERDRHLHPAAVPVPVDDGTDERRDGGADQVDEEDRAEGHGAQVDTAARPAGT